MIEPEELAFCEVHTDTSQFNTPASPLYSDAFHSGTNPSAVELTALSTSDHTRDPRALIYLIPIVLITAVLLLGRMAC